MRRRVILRRTRLPRAVLGLPMLTLPALGAGLAYAAGPAGHTSSSRSITANVRQRRIAYGDELIVTGRTPSSQRYHSVRLSFSPVGGRHWRRIASARVGPHDRFRFHVRLRSSGRVRVTGWQPSSTSGDPGSGGATIPTTTSPQGSNPSASTARAQSRPHRVAVAARLHVGYHAARDLGGHAITVPGTLAPADRGRHHFGCGLAHAPRRDEWNRR